MYRSRFEGLTCLSCINVTIIFLQSIGIHVGKYERTVSLPLLFKTPTLEFTTFKAGMKKNTVKAQSILDALTIVHVQNIVVSPQKAHTHFMHCCLITLPIVSVVKFLGTARFKGLDKKICNENFDQS